jgi:hypothetical protein
MMLPEQTNETLWPINDERAESRDVTAEYTHITGFRSRDRSMLPAKHDFATVLTGQSNPSFPNDRVDHSSHPAKLFLGDD